MSTGSDKTVEMPRALAEMIAGNDAAIAGLDRMSDEEKREILKRAHMAHGTGEFRELAENIAKFK